ncbi:MarR family transcriptional regulator [candidate division KSB1 bacterium]|nr:MarR family transcriptional regulator [candidate division KSB1 bacterium]
MDHIQRLAPLFTRLMHVLHHLAGQASKIGDFSLAQYRVLMLVMHRGPMSIKQLQQRLMIAQSSASGMVDRLEQQGWLQREKSPADHRLTLFRLTKKAESLLHKRMQDMEIVYRQLMQPLSIPEQEELLSAFETILRLVEKSQPDQHTP